MRSGGILKSEVLTEAEQASKPLVEMNSEFYQAILKKYGFKNPGEVLEESKIGG